MAMENVDYTRIQVDSQSWLDLRLGMSQVVLMFGVQRTMASDSCQKVIVDCDPGIDDAQAIIMLLTQKHIQVVAITTVFGNETVEITSRNALRVLKLCKRLDVSCQHYIDCCLYGKIFQTTVHRAFGFSCCR